MNVTAFLPELTMARSGIPSILSFSVLCQILIIFSDIIREETLKKNHPLYVPGTLDYVFEPDNSHIIILISPLECELQDSRGFLYFILFPWDLKQSKSLINNLQIVNQI